MKIRCVWEHNGNDSLLYAADYTGAFTRGASREEIALAKMQHEDSDVMFEGERAALTQEEYARLKEMALKSASKSASDFLRLYAAVPDNEFKLPGAAQELHRRNTANRKRNVCAHPKRKCVLFRRNWR